jgi:hypothetical protein
MTLRDTKPPIGPYAPHLLGVQNAAGIMAECGRNDKGDNEVHKEWALEGSNLRPSDYESVPNVVPDGQGADSGGISGPLRTGTDTGRHRVESVPTYRPLRPIPSRARSLGGAAT